MVDAFIIGRSRQSRDLFYNNDALDEDINVFFFVLCDAFVC